MSSRSAGLLVCLLGLSFAALLPAQETEDDPEVRGREVPDPLYRYSQRRRELEARGMVTYFHSFLGRNRGPILSEYLGKWKTPEGQIWHNEDLHVLAITDTPQNIELLKAILKIIDRPDPQVLIEVRVVEVSYDSSFELGTELSWNGTAEVLDTNEKLFGTLGDATSVFQPDSFLDALATRSTFQGYTMSGRLALDSNNQVGTVDSLLRTLSAKGQAEILSAPRILVVNGKKASFLSGEKVPIQTVQIVNNATTISTRFEDVGVKLDVTPIILGENAVELDVSSEVSTITGFTQAGLQGVSNPIISTRRVNSTVYVRDGETLIIGGLLRNESVVSQTGVPFFMDIPILGYLFKKYRKTSRKSELIFFMTPHIRLQQNLTLPPRERER